LIHKAQQTMLDQKQLDDDLLKQAPKEASPFLDLINRPAVSLAVLGLMIALQWVVTGASTSIGAIVISFTSVVLNAIFFGAILGIAIDLIRVAHIMSKYGKERLKETDSLFKFWGMLVIGCMVQLIVLFVSIC
jgi:uncharacterized membrane protein